MTIASSFTMEVQSIGLMTNCHAGQQWYDGTQSRWLQVER